MFCSVYRATFPKTYKEIRAGPGHYKIVVPAVAFGIGLSYVIYWIMGKTGKSMQYLISDGYHFESILVNIHGCKTLASR